MTEKLSDRQAAIIGAYTGVLCGDFPVLHAYIEEVMKRPVWTHELASPEIVEQIRLASLEDFKAICP
jgi:hypothetical protein